MLSFYTSIRVSEDDGWLLLCYYRTNIITTADFHWVTQQEFRHASYQGRRGRRDCVDVCTHACKCVGSCKKRRRGGDQWVGKTQKTKGCVSCARAVIAHLAVEKRQRGERERERGGCMENRRYDQKDCGHNDEASGWTDGFHPVCSHQCQRRPDRHSLASRRWSLALMPLDLRCHVTSPKPACWTTASSNGWHPFFFVDCISGGPYQSSTVCSLCYQIF